MTQTAKRRVGRPNKWETPEQLRDLINQYLDETPFEELTVSGMALFLGTNRRGVDDYKNKPGFKEIIDEAKLIIENSYEMDLRKKGRTTDIFAMKNFGWTDKSEVDMNTTVNIVNRTISVEETNA